MTQGEVKRPIKVIAERMRGLRDQKGWSALRLAEEMTRVGVPWDRSIVANIENGRRASIGVEELLALAYVLNVAPVHLLVPTDAPAGDDYQVTPTNVVPVTDARAWVRGFKALQDTDMRQFYAAVPEVEFSEREDLPERNQWVWGVVAYLLRSMGQLYRVEGTDTAFFRVEMPSPRPKDGPER